MTASTAYTSNSTIFYINVIQSLVVHALLPTGNITLNNYLNTSFIYNIGDPPLSINFNNFTEVPNIKLPITYNVVDVNTSSRPSFI